jgi:hypothetical protein
MPSFSFSIMDAAGYGFYRVWCERSYLLKLALIPFFIKLACMVAVAVLGYETNVLRQGLILLPGILAEGWVLAQFCRTLLKDERWPTVLPEKIDDNVLDRLLLRARGIIACTLSYALIGLAFFSLRYLAFLMILGDAVNSEEEVANLLASSTDADAPAPEMAPIMIVPSIILLAFTFWAVRLMWVYIPLSVLMPIRDYLKILKGPMSSVRLLALFFCTFTPVMFLVAMCSHLIFGVTEGMGDSAEDIRQFAMIFVSVIAELLIALASTAAVVWAMRDFLPKNPNLLKELPKVGGE